MRVYSQHLRMILLAGVTMLALMLCGAGIAADAVNDFQQWLLRYQRGKIDLHQFVKSGFRTRLPDGSVSTLSYSRSDALEKLDQLLEGLRERGDLPAGRLLLEAATYTADESAEVELKKHYQRQPWVLRRLAADSLGQIRNEEVTAYLCHTILADHGGPRNARRRAAAADALGKMRNLGAVDPLSRVLTEDDDPVVRMRSARALGNIGRSECTEPLRAGLRDPDDRVRLEALLAVDRVATATLDTEQAEETGTTRLQVSRRLLSDPSWPIRLTATRLLGEHPDSVSVSILIGAIMREAPDRKGTRRRVRKALRKTLATMTGQDFPSFRASDWKKWWEENSSTFELEKELTEDVAPEQGGRFLGIPLESDEVVFLMDISGSMERPLSGDPDGTSRHYLAMRELQRCLDSLEDGTRFNVILFNEDLTAFSPEPVEKSETTAEQAILFVEGARVGGGTNLYDALEFVLRLSDPAGELESGNRELDTVVLLTDGAPSRGPVLLDEEIIHQVTEKNRARQIAIHTISAGSSGGEFLKKLAEANHGSSRPLHP